ARAREGIERPQDERAPRDLDERLGRADARGLEARAVAGREDTGEGARSAHAAFTAARMPSSSSSRWMRVAPGATPGIEAGAYQTGTRPAPRAPSTSRGTESPTCATR